ncbi:MAG: hypothetical protein ABI761_12595 [Saprospiraceae bacterium]
MFDKLKARWNVSGKDLFIILLTFALGGSMCGWLGRKLLALFNMPEGIIWVASYIVLICLLWPVCVLTISIFTGQYSFFKKYLIKIKAKMFGCWILLIPMMIDQTWITPTLNGTTGA